MDAYWDAVWQIAGILAIFGICLAVSGAVVIALWIGLRRLSGDAGSTRAALGYGASAPRFARSRPAPRPAKAAAASSQPAGQALPPPDAMGHTPKAALGERSGTAASNH